MLEKDYRKLYQTQDKILLALKPVLSTFYLTGGTALGRFYLNHRFSEDLDFFLNKSDTFHSSVKNIEKAIKIIANDFFLGLDNSLGKNKPAIEDAEVIK